MTQKREVTAVLLSLDEPSVERALASIASQSLPFADVVRVERVTPFHRALNDGAARVRTEFFVQVDADMILDDDCAERLAACTRPEVGAVIGMLRDPLYGRVEAIKLFRTAELTRLGFDDSISPDTDYLGRMERAGRYMVYAIRHDRAPEHWHTFGEHRPEYEPLYTFERNKRDGRRIRHRGEAESVRFHLDLLHRSRHPSALVAEVAIAHGLFFDWAGDRQDGACEDGADFRRLTDLLARLPPGSREHNRGTLRARIDDAAAAAALVGSAERVFRASYSLGTALSAVRDGAAFVAALDARHRVHHPWAWLAQAALCRGLFAGLVPDATADEDWRRLGVFRARLAATSPLRLVRDAGRARVAALAPKLFGKR
jgi:hypothetical protein